MNTFTKLSAKTLMQLLATAMITLTLFSCGGSSTAPITPPATDTTGDGSDDTTGDGTDDATDDGTDDTTGGGGDGTTPTVTPTIISANDAIVSTLSALATGTPSQVVISWSAVQGEGKYYRLYKSTTTLSNYQNASPANLSTSSTVTFTTHTINASTITLNDAQTAYFLVTTIRDSDTNDDKFESYTNATQTAATAFAMPFLTVVSTGTGYGGRPTPLEPTNRVWMDRNLGATRTAISSTDTLAYGDLYQWGRSADGHQIRTSTGSDTIVGSITPAHGQFITPSESPFDWTTADSSGTLRSAYWARTDGSSICPTGFRVPTSDELKDEFDSWSSSHTEIVYEQNLKLLVTGRRYSNATFNQVGTAGYIWSLTPDTNDSTKSIYLSFSGSSDSNAAAIRAHGYPVRCIKPE